MSWRHWLRRGRLTGERRERDIEREIRAHLDLEAEERGDAGLSAEDARRAAERAFGNRTLISEELRAMWGTPTLDAILQDVRYALRTMRRAPGFTAIAVGSAALGIGACSVIFAILNFAIFQPLPVDEPGDLMSLSETDRRTGDVGNELSYPDFRDLRQARSFEAIAASNPLVPASIGSAGDPQRHWGAVVTANYFAVVRPGFVIGRGFDAPRDDTPGAAPVVILSHDLWQTRFGGDPSIVGRVISVNKRAATVVGVTEAGFRGTDAGIVSAFWIPFSMLEQIESRLGPVSENRQRHWLKAVGRLRHGVDAGAARAELDVIARRLNTTSGGGDDSRSFYLERAGQIDPRLRRMTKALFSLFSAATALVLLTACANIANLLLGRASARRREIAARMALGASRGRLVRQLLTESLVMALLGGAGAWIIAASTASLMGRLRVPLGWPLDLSISLDYRVLLFCMALSVATSVVAGLLPALRATRLDLVTDLKADVRGIGGVRRFSLRNALVVGQMAICTLLLVCTGLFLRSLLTARAMDTGMSNRNLILLAFDPGLERRTDPQIRNLLRQILEEARGVPGVEAATLTSDVPLTYIINNSSFVRAGSETDPKTQPVGADIYGVGPQFFETMGIAFLAGEDFRLVGTATTRRAIVNDAFARAVFPGESPIGRRVAGDGKMLEIVGLVATAKSRTIGEAPRPSIYLPILTEYSAGQSLRGVTLVAQTTAAAASFAGPMRDAIRRSDPSLAVFDVKTIETHLSDALLVPRLAGILSATAGSIGLVIATIGVYGVITFGVARRRREIGIRLAVGAKPREVRTMILKQGITLALVGGVLGVLAALGVSRFAASLLYGVNPRDAVTFVSVPVLLTSVAWLACLLPARAAARMNPVDVLRSE